MKQPRINTESTDQEGGARGDHPSDRRSKQTGELPSVLEFSIDGIPQGTPRARHSATVNKATMKAFVRVYTPERNHKSEGKKNAEGYGEWKARVRAAVEQACGGKLPGATPAGPWTGAIRMDIEAFFPRTQDLERKRMPDGRILYTKKPDRDNLDKGIMDALTHLTEKRATRGKNRGRITRPFRAGLWQDDDQVCLGEIQKWYVARGGTPGIRVVIEHLGDPIEIARKEEGERARGQEKQMELKP